MEKAVCRSMNMDDLKPMPDAPRAGYFKRAVDSRFELAIAKNKQTGEYILAYIIQGILSEYIPDTPYRLLPELDKNVYEFHMYY